MHKLITYFSWFMVIYACLQRIGIDIAKLDTRELSPVVLTFGNSNFAGGMISVFFAYHAIFHVLSKKIQLKDMALLILLVGASTFPAAVQGYLIIVFTCFFAISIFVLQRHKSIWLRRAVVISWALGLIAITLGLLGKSILAPIFARSSFQARIEYWRIAISIIKDNLILGVGPDKLYDVTAYYMSPGSLKLITSTRMDNAHNWFLNLAANYGLIASVALLFIFGYVFVVGMIQLSKSLSSNPIGYGSFGAFIALFIDGLVSIEQPGIGVWLYFFGGVTLGNWLNIKKQLSPSEVKLGTPSKIPRLFLQNIITVLNIIGLTISSFFLSERIYQDAILRSNIQTQLLGKGTESTLENIGSMSINLKQEPEYVAQALRSLAAVGARDLLESSSKASYDYYPNSIQAALIRADVLRALDRLDESCPLRITLINNTPWDLSQLNNYLLCLINGQKDPNYLETLRKTLIYLPIDRTKELAEPEIALEVLEERYNINAIGARVNYLLGNLEDANLEKFYASELLKRIQEIEIARSLTPPQPDRNDSLKLLNF